MLRGVQGVVLFIASAALAATSLLLSLPTASTGPPPDTALALAQVLERQGLTSTIATFQLNVSVLCGIRWGVHVTNTAQVKRTSLTGKARPRALACGSLHGGQGGSLVPPHTC